MGIGTLAFTEISTKRIGRGTNVNATTAIPANRVCSYSTSTTHDDPIDLASVGGAAKFAGVTSHAIAVGETGDLHTEGVVPVESDGTGAIAIGDYLTASVTADATNGRCKVAVAIDETGVNLIGRAVSVAAATPGLLVMVDLDLKGQLSGS